MTAVAITHAQAHERGELHLDDPITTHLPTSVTDGLHVHDGRDHTAQMTLRHLASHTSGLGDHFENPWGWSTPGCRGRASR